MNKMNKMNKQEKREIIINLRCEIGELVAGHKAEDCEEALDYAIKCIDDVENLLRTYCSDPNG